MDWISTTGLQYEEYLTDILMHAGYKQLDQCYEITSNAEGGALK